MENTLTPQKKHTHGCIQGCAGVLILFSLIIGAIGFMALSSDGQMGFSFGMFSAGYSAPHYGVAFVIFIVAVLIFIWGIGMRRQRKWARWVMIISLGILLLNYLLAPLNTPVYNPQMPFIQSTTSALDLIIMTVVIGGVAMWFIYNEQYFTD